MATVIIIYLEIDSYCLPQTRFIFFIKLTIVGYPIDVDVSPTTVIMII